MFDLCLAAILRSFPPKVFPDCLWFVCVQQVSLGCTNNLEQTTWLQHQVSSAMRQFIQKNDRAIGWTTHLREATSNNLSLIDIIMEPKKSLINFAQVSTQVVFLTVYLVVAVEVLATLQLLVINRIRAGKEKSPLAFKALFRL